MEAKGLLEQAQQAQAEEIEAQKRLVNAKKALRKAIVQGGTTDDRQLDLAIVLMDKLNRDDGVLWSEFERTLRQNPGQLLMITKSWQEGMVKHIIDTGCRHGEMTVRAHIVCVVSKVDPILSFEKEFGNAMLPIDRYIVVQEEADKWPAVVECPNPVSLLEMVTSLPGMHMMLYPPKSENYVVGTEAVMKKLEAYLYRLTLSAGRDRNPTQEIMALLGIEHFGADGQGVLGVSGVETTPEPA